MTARPNRLAYQRHVTEMIALDTIVSAHSRVCNLLAHGRRMTMVTRLIRKDGTSGTPDVRAGLTLAEPVTMREHHGGVSVAAVLSGSVRNGIGFSAFPGESETAAAVWASYRAGDRRDMTQIKITGGMTSDGPAADDQLIVQQWDESGQCRETVIGFDYGTGPCNLLGTRTRVDDVLNNLSDQQPWDIRKLLEEVQRVLWDHVNHPAGDVAALLALVERYGDERESIAGAMAVAGGDEVAHHTGVAQTLLAEIRGHLTPADGADVPRCCVCGEPEQLTIDPDGAYICELCVKTRIPEDETP